MTSPDWLEGEDAARPRPSEGPVRRSQATHSLGLANSAYTGLAWPHAWGVSSLSPPWVLVSRGQPRHGALGLGQKPLAGDPAARIVSPLYFLCGFSENQFKLTPFSHGTASQQDDM